MNHNIDTYIESLSDDEAVLRFFLAKCFKRCNEPKELTPKMIKDCIKNGHYWIYLRKIHFYSAQKLHMELVKLQKDPFIEVQIIRKRKIVFIKKRERFDDMIKKLIVRLQRRWPHWGP